METVCGRTYWLVNVLIVVAFANQAKLILRLLLRSWAGGSVHQSAGSCMRARQTLWVSPVSSWGCYRPSRCLSGLYRFR